MNFETKKIILISSAFFCLVLNTLANQTLPPTIQNGTLKNNQFSIEVGERWAIEYSILEGLDIYINDIEQKELTTKLVNKEANKTFFLSSGYIETSFREYRSKDKYYDGNGNPSINAHYLANKDGGTPESLNNPTSAESEVFTEVEELLNFDELKNYTKNSLINDGLTEFTEEEFLSNQQNLIWSFSMENDNEKVSTFIIDLSEENFLFIIGMYQEEYLESKKIVETFNFFSSEIDFVANDKQESVLQSTDKEIVRFGYAPDTISGFSVISTGSDGTKYDPVVFSDHGIASRHYADRDYQYEKISSTQGKIIYPFSGGDDDKPEVTIVTFSSLNEGTYLWTEYADSALQNPVDTDQGSWKMIPGYERTADSQNPDLAPESIAGLLSEYISANDSSYEIIYFSNNGSATAHSDGRIYSYEKTSDNQGIITYSFENEAVPKPEITNITFTSLNGGTFTWTEYSDSSLSSILGTDTGTWVMASGYERTAESSLSQTSGDVMNKWVESGWLGVFFEATNGWIYHPDLGWMYAENSSGDKTWLYSDKKGWLWTSKDAYPYLYSDNSSNWVYVVSDQDAPTKAFDYNPKEWSLWQDLTLMKMVQPGPNKLSTSTADEKKVYEIINSNASDKDKLNRIAEAIRSRL
jgi:hypothetical protein